MLTFEQAYQKTLLKVEKNSTNDNSSIDRGRWVLIFNEAQNKFIEFNLQNRGVDDVRYIQRFLNIDQKIPYSSKTQDYYNFPLPKNYLDLADARAEISIEGCKPQKAYLVEVRPENLNEKLQDEYYKPSFKWRETLFLVNSENISVYTLGEFIVNNLILSYYRYPNQAKLQDAENPDSKFDESVELEWDDKSLDRIISIIAGEFDMNESDQRFQLQTLRTQK